MLNQAQAALSQENPQKERMMDGLLREWHKLEEFRI